MGRKPTNRRELIVEVAHRRFTADGYHRTSIGDLARELDISKAAIAYYFPTKDAFLVAFVSPFLDAVELAVNQAADARGALVGYFDCIVADHQTAVWVDTDPAVQNHPDFGGRLSKINERMAARLTSDSDETADQIRAMAVLGGIWRPAREFGADDLVAHRDEIIDSAIDGF